MYEFDLQRCNLMMSKFPEVHGKYKKNAIFPSYFFLSRPEQKFLEIRKFDEKWHLCDYKNKVWKKKKKTLHKKGHLTSQTLIQVMVQNKSADSSDLNVLIHFQGANFHVSIVTGS